MRIGKPEIDDQTAEAAAGWVARLQSSDATDSDRRDFDRWLDADPSHRPAYEEMRGLWSDLKGLSQAPRKRSSRKAAASIIGLCLLAAAAAILHIGGMTDRWRADYYTDVGEVRTVTLQDGTRVDLNSDTAIVVHYSQSERRVDLLRGEAFFDVAKNAARPFVVADNRVRAQALGTRYSMRVPSSGWGEEVQVEEGHVEVATSADSKVLEAGEVATLGNDGRLAVTRRDVTSDTAWRGGKLVFSGRPLREVLATLDRYRHGRILLLDDRAGSLAVSGIFDLADTDKALRILEENLPLSVTRMPGLMVIVRAR